MVKLILFILFNSLCFGPCCQKSTEPVYECQSSENTINMIFNYGVQAKNCLNTFECTYTKDLILDPSITINFQLSKTELDSIYRKMIQVDLFSYPDTFKYVGDIMSPFSTYKFYIETDTIQKSLYWEANVFTPNQEADKLRELISLIIDTIESKNEYQKLPAPRGGYL